MPDDPSPQDRGPSDDLLAEVAHELTNPLAIAQGFAASLLDHPELGEEGRQAAAAIDRNVRIALQLLNNYREAARPGDEPITLELEWVAVTDLACRTVADLSSITDTHEIDVEHPDTEIRVLADGGRLRQALFNLLSNAVKHTPPESAIHVRTWQEEGSVTIEVADEGDGVAPAVADRIFQPRVQGEDAPEGLGLGLYVAKRIAQAHGGDLQLVPAEGRGATFHLTLPAHADRTS